MFQGLMTVSALTSLFFAAFSSSSSYQLQNYGIGSGGTNNSASGSYKLNASSGEASGAPSTGTTDVIKSGSTEVRQANVPLAPTLSNGGGNYYNKLQVTINTSGSDASDYTYSIAASTNSFATVLYVQADGTLGATAVYQSYAAWGGASGTPMIGLTGGTTYQVKVNAMQATYTASAYGPIASAATANPSLSFSLNPTAVSLGSLTAGSVVTAGSSIAIGFATNGASGGAVYIAGANNGLKSTASNYTIPTVSADLTSQTQGFGGQGLTVGQTSGGPLSITSPYNGTGGTVGAINTNFRQLVSASTALVGGTATATVKGKASSTTPYGSDYTETLTFIASASF